MTSRLAGKRAIVTGAGRGIGAAIAQSFARAGAAVMIAERDAASAAAMAAAIVADGGAAQAIEADVSDPAQVERMVAAAATHLGGLDILVNNAGVNVFHRPHETSDAEWRRCLAVDLEAAWHCARNALPLMRSAGSGSIINIASTHAFSIIPHTFPYPVAKHALLGLTRALAIEYAAEGIRVNAIAPGYIETELATLYWDSQPDPEAARAAVERMHPPGRIGKPEEVAMTALFLASDEAPFINGACIVIDGGRSLLYHD
jgi:NAD(P)-dependent dehydrogenase (short-subunit alcohol dehydrogenase family)